MNRPGDSQSEYASCLSQQFYERCFEVAFKICANDLLLVSKVLPRVTSGKEITELEGSSIINNL